MPVHSITEIVNAITVKRLLRCRCFHVPTSNLRKPMNGLMLVQPQYDDAQEAYCVDRDSPLQEHL